MKKRHYQRWAGALGLLVLIGLWLSPGSVVWAQTDTQTKVELSETELAFNGLVNESLQRTFNLVVKGAAIENVTVVRHDLVDAHEGRAILSTDITVDPLNIAQAEGAQRFSVTIPAGQNPGHYTGTLEIQYGDPPDDVTLEVALAVTLAAVPNVDVEAEAKNLSLFAAPTWLSLPVGRPSAGPNAPELGQTTLTLVQDVEGEAIVEEVDVLTMRGPKGQTLPQDAVRVDARFPLTLSGKDSTSVRIVAVGRNLNAGEYNGNLQLKVRNQPAAVQVPLKVLVKDGPLLPLILLIVGPLVGILVATWNSGGKARYDLYKRIESLRKRVETIEWVQVQDLVQAQEKLNATMEAMREGVAVDKVTGQVDALDQSLGAAQTAAQDLSNDQVVPLIASYEDIAVSATYRQVQIAQLETIRERVKRRGGFKDLDEARDWQREIQARYDRLKATADRFESLDPKYQSKIRDRLEQATDLSKIEDMVERLAKVAEGVSALPADYQDKAEAWLARAASLEEMERLLKRLQEVVEYVGGLAPEKRAQIEPELKQAATVEALVTASGMPTAKGPIVVGAYAQEVRGVVPERRPEPVKVAWERTKLNLKIQRLAVMGVAYLFTLAVGWVTLYAVPDTFGADPRDYITLFLWGVTSNLVGAQTISLESIFQKTKEPGDGEGEG
jgi:hypothetical protein